MSRILITGAFGLLGSSLANYFKLSNKETGIFVYALDDGLLNPYENLKFSIYKYAYSYDRIDAYKVFANRRFDVVYHFAGYKVSNEGIPAIDADYFLYENNVAKTSKLISLCERYGAKFVFASALDLSPSIFRNSKLMVELDIKSRKNLEWCIVRFGHLYGDRQRFFEGDFNLLGSWMWSFFRGEPFRIQGSGSARVIVNYVKDFLVPLYNIALENKVWGREVNLGLNAVSVNRLCRSFLSSIKFYKDWDSDDDIVDGSVVYVDGDDYRFDESTDNAFLLGCEDFSGDPSRLKYNVHDFSEAVRNRVLKGIVKIDRDV